MNSPLSSHAASLFAPRVMKPNPSSSDAIRDPLGRDSHLWDQEEDDPDIGGKLEAARAAFPKDSEGRNIEKNGYRPIAPVIEEYKKRLDALQGRKP